METFDFSSPLKIIYSVVSLISLVIFLVYRNLALFDGIIIALLELIKKEK